MDLVIYLNQMNRICCLTPLEEVQYGQQVHQFQALLQVRDRLTHEQHHPPTHSDSHLKAYIHA